MVRARGPSYKGKRSVKDATDEDWTLFFVGFQEGDIVWAAHKIVSVAPDHVMLKSGQGWPHWRKVPYTIEQLEMGQIHSDDLTLGLSLDKALSLRTSMAQKKKDRADRIYNSLTLMRRAIVDGDRSRLHAMMATEGT